MRVSFQLVGTTPVDLNQWSYSYKTDSVLNNCNYGRRKSLSTTMIVATNSISNYNVASVDSAIKSTQKHLLLPKTIYTEFDVSSAEPSSGSYSLIIFRRRNFARNVDRNYFLIRFRIEKCNIFMCFARLDNQRRQINS